ncbi:MAG: phosphate propanoyltransferase [Eubacteriaceae bacterium]|nr:phosphate propanoyltransferase [Eubacteriaceae bacterium]
MKERKVLINISNRHLHLSAEDLEILFGEGAELTNIKDLIQPGQFACDEIVELVGPKGSIPGVRVIGPIRKQTQVEVLIADTYKLGIPIVIRDSGDLKDSPGIKIIGSKGEVELSEGTIVAARHFHLHTTEGAEMGFKDQDRVSIKVGGERGVVYENILVRVADNGKHEFHLDVEEANAGLVKNGDFGVIVE